MCFTFLGVSNDRFYQLDHLSGPKNVRENHTLSFPNIMRTSQFKKYNSNPKAKRSVTLQSSNAQRGQKMSNLGRMQKGSTTR